MINVAIADDQFLIRQGLQKILAAAADITVSVMCGSEEELLPALETSRPDVLLLDIQMPGRSGTELASIILKKFPGIKIIALANVDTLTQVKQMLEKGCMGYLLKDVSPETLISAIEAVHNGRQFVQENLKKQLNNSSGNKQLITRREKEILRLILEGNTTEAISGKLLISIKTVENHRNNILQKLNVNSTSGLARLLLQDEL